MTQPQPKGKPVSPELEAQHAEVLRTLVIQTKDTAAYLAEVQRGERSTETAGLEALILSLSVAQVVLSRELILNGEPE